MMKKLLVGLIIGFGLISCSKPKVVEHIKNDSTTITLFKSVYDTLGVMQVPINLTPDSWWELQTKHVDKYGIGEGWELMKHPYARLAENEDYKAIIFVSTDETGSPTIITLNRSGNPIDTLFLLGGWGGNDESIATSEIATINADLTIHLIDSTSTFEVDSVGGRIDSTGQLSVKNEMFRITESGEIIKIK